MKKIILKTIIVLLPILLTNLVIGVLRNKNGDETIPYKQNWLKQFISRGQIGKKTGKIISDYQTFDMSREVRKLQIVNYIDKWGFQNKKEIKNPDILFVGDSFFEDPFLSYEQSLSFNIPLSMNISSMGCSGFQVFNELKTHDYFTKAPKYIIIEVVERNLYTWVNLFDQIKLKQLKTKNYNYFGLDLLFGNNFRGADFDNLSFEKQNSKSNKIGTIRKIDKNRNIYFLKNKISSYDSEILRNIITSMELVNQYFSKYNCQVIYVVAPDKESIFPELFGNSNLPYVQKQFEIAHIDYIDMYSEIMQSSKRKECYYDGDTHWNNIAYELLIEKIKLAIKN